MAEQKPQTIGDLKSTMKWQTGILVTVILAIVGLAGRWADSVDSNISAMQKDIQTLRLDMVKYGEQINPVSSLTERVRELERVIDRMGQDRDAK